jgi:hypothetical protein
VPRRPKSLVHVGRGAGRLLAAVRRRRVRASEQGSMVLAGL